MKLLLNNIKDTIKLGKKLAELSKNGDIFCLKGALGTGKTTLARAFIKYLTNNDKVLSPTFPLLLTYEYKNNIIWHYDMYRLENTEDIWNLSMEEALNDGIILIEWPEIIEKLLPITKIDIIIKDINHNARSVEISANKEFKQKITGFQTF